MYYPRLKQTTDRLFLLILESPQGNGKGIINEKV